MLAREEEEFEMYQEFDRLRYEQEKHIYHNFAYGVNYRLMPEEDVPDFIKIKEEKKKPVLGRRRNYRDFYNVKPDIDESSEEERRNKKKAAQRQKRRRRAKARAKAKAKDNVNTKVNIEVNPPKQNQVSLKNPRPNKNIQNDDIFVDSDD